MTTKHGFKQLSNKDTRKVNKEELVTYTAMVSKNKRNTHIGTPVVLLRGVMTEDTEFRDHCWVRETPELFKLLETKHASRYQGSYIIEFKAKEKKYNYHMSGNMKDTLDHICEVKVLGKA